MATAPRPSTHSAPSASGGSPRPAHATTPSSIRIEPPGISVPASSIVTTASQESMRSFATAFFLGRCDRAHPLGREEHGVQDLLVARASAQVARQRLAYL